MVCTRPALLIMILDVHLIHVHRCIVTRSSYTKSEDFQAADAVVDELGAAGGVALQDLTVSGLAKLKH